MNLRQGIVVDTHPEDNSVDLVMMDDHSRLIGVQIMAQNGSTRSGSVSLPSVPKKKDKWDITQRTGQDQIAIVGFIRSNPVIVGYLLPQVNQMTFEDKKRAFSRHESDVYQTVDGDGNMEVHHPSGAYVRIAVDPKHEDLEGKNFDKNLKIDRNKDKKAHIRIAMGDKAWINISPEGDITFKARTMTWDMQSLTSNGDIIANGVSLTGHTHGGVQPGGGQTSTPSGAQPPGEPL